KAIAFLKEKYTSADQIRSYFAEKLGRLEVRHDGDAQGLRALKEAVATASMIAAQCDDKTVTTDLFDMVFRRLTTRLRHDLHVETGAKRDIEKVVPFLERELKILWVSELSGCKQDQPKEHERKRQPQKEFVSMEAAKPKQRLEKEVLKCYFCGETGHGAMGCESLAKINCRKCGKPGHTRKFCHKANAIGSVCLISEHPVKPRRSEAERWRKPKAIETTTVSDHRVRCKVEVGKKDGGALVDTGEGQLRRRGRRQRSRLQPCPTTECAAKWRWGRRMELPWSTPVRSRRSCPRRWSSWMHRRRALRWPMERASCGREARLSWS